MSVSYYPFHSQPIKLLNKGMDFSFLPLKLPNKEREEYSKIILFIPFPSPKRGLKDWVVAGLSWDIYVAPCHIYCIFLIKLFVCFIK